MELSMLLQEADSTLQTQRDSTLQTQRDSTLQTQQDSKAQVPTNLVLIECNGDQLWRKLTLKS